MKINVDTTADMLKIRHLKAGIAQLVEHDLAKVGVASSNLVSRSKHSKGKHKLPFFAQAIPPNGWVAEWLCTGLQSRVPRFDSGPSLHFYHNYHIVQYIR